MAIRGTFSIELIEEITFDGTDLRIVGKVNGKSHVLGLSAEDKPIFKVSTESFNICLNEGLITIRQMTDKDLGRLMEWSINNKVKWESYCDTDKIRTE